MKLKILFIISALFLGSFVAKGQIMSWNFTSGNTPNVNLPGGSTALSFNTSGTNATSGCGSNGFSTNNWNVNEYLQIVAPTTGYNITTVSFNVQSSGTGPRNFKVQYSSTGTGGTFTDLGTTFTNPDGSCASRNFDLTSINALDNNANTVIRLVFTGGEADGSPATGDAAPAGTFRIDDLVINGSAALDVTPPTVTTFSPLDDATGVAINSNLVLTFNENVVVGTAGNIVIYNAADNSVFETIPYNDGRITYNGTTGVTINPTGTFVNSAGYYVQIANTAIRDVAGNTYLGISNTTSWNFTVEAPDLTPPTVSTFSPADNATGVAINSNLVLTFNENVVVGTTGNIVIYNAADNSVFETIPYNDGRITFSGANVTINPTGTFVNSAGYYVQIANTAIRDVAGNTYVGISNTTTWNFTAEAPSTIIWTNPITGSDPSTTNPFISGDVKNANITVSGISRGSGIGANSGGNRYNANGWESAAFNANDYFEFTLTPNAGFEIDFTDFVYSSQRSGANGSEWVDSFAFRSSIDTYTANIGTPNVGTNVTISLTAAAYQNRTTATTFRIYGWGADAATRTFSIDDFTFNGTVTQFSTNTDNFRSRATGVWSTASNWESSPDNTNWITSTLVPTSAANSITIRNSHTITISGAATADQITVASGGTLALNAANLTLNDGTGTDLTIASGGTFDNGGENQIISGGGTPAIAISGTFITKDAQGFVGSNTAIPGITPTLNSGSTIEYGLAGNQTVQGTTSPTYQNITFSGGGTKTLASTNAVTGTITVAGATTFDADNKTFGSNTSNITMTGASIYKLHGSSVSKPESGGTYTLDPLSTFEFTGTSDTSIRVSSPTINYANVIISGIARNPATVTGIKLQPNCTFTVKNGGVFRLNNTAGFTGSTATAIDNTNSPTVTLETGSRVEFSGNQTLPTTQTITPFGSYSDVGISGTGTKTLANTTEIYVGRDLLLLPESTPANSGFLQIDADRLLTVERNILNTSTKDLIVKNNGNLVQLSNVLNTTLTNTGNIKMTRTSRNMANVHDYVYWGSPVKENVYSQIPTAVYDLNYQWDLTGAINGNWNTFSLTTPGRGFISRVKTGGTGAKDFDFTGTPNNGTVSVYADCYSTAPTANVPGNQILLSNPYPCAIDAADFVNTNSSILDGTLYFWTSSTQYLGGNYVVGDYATWNITGGVGTGPTTNNDVALIPNGKIASGQGFFAPIKADGNITFDNSMRFRNAGNNSQFFKTKANKQKASEKHRVWLNLSNDKQAFRQTLVGYVTGATNDFEGMFDGISNTNNEIDLYSILYDKQLVIQGRSLPFDENDLIPMGVSITNAGSYTLAIDEVDGLLKNQDIYIEDKLTNLVHNLKTSPYHFNINSGVFNDRFVLRYTDKTLGNPDVEMPENEVIVSITNQKIKVNSFNQTIDNIEVFDLLGRQLFKKDTLNTNEFTIENFQSSSQVLLVKVKLNDGNLVAKKLAFNKKN